MPPLPVRYIARDNLACTPYPLRLSILHYGRASAQSVRSRVGDKNGQDTRLPLQESALSAVGDDGNSREVSEILPVFSWAEKYPNLIVWLRYSQNRFDLL